MGLITAAERTTSRTSLDSLARLERWPAPLGYSSYPSSGRVESRRFPSPVLFSLCRSTQWRADRQPTCVNWTDQIVGFFFFSLLISLVTMKRCSSFAVPTSSGSFIGVRTAVSRLTGPQESLAHKSCLLGLVLYLMAGWMTGMFLIRDSSCQFCAYCGHCRQLPLAQMISTTHAQWANDRLSVGGE